MHGYDIILWGPSRRQDPANKNIYAVHGYVRLETRLAPNLEAMAASRDAGAWLPKGLVDAVAACGEKKLCMWYKRGHCHKGKKCKLV